MSDRPTLLDIAKANGSDAVVGLIDETTKAHPELRIVPARTIKGRMYKTLVRTANPTVSFRNANDGVDSSRGVYENRLVETFILEPRWECDKAVADGYEDGPQAFIAMEGEAQMNAATKHLASQFYYGVTNDAKGFPGLLASLNVDEMEVDAGGTTADTASSVWAVKFGPQYVTWVWGDNGELQMGEVRIETITGVNGKPLTGYVHGMVAHPGLQVGNKYSIGRIKNLTEDPGKGLTDDLLATLISKFPAGLGPDALFMSRRSLAQLRSSRTATNPSGTPAPFPAEAFGLPIQVTDAIVETEAIAA